MNKILDDYLCETYPKIFVQRKLSPKVSCLGRGFECGKGWFLLINDLCFQIQKHIDNRNKYLQENEKPVSQFVALQVKEKLGSLTIYYEGGDDYCRGLVNMASKMSTRTCEICGFYGLDVGKTTGFCIQYLCSECSSKEKREISHNEDLIELMEKVKEDGE